MKYFRLQSPETWACDPSPRWVMDKVKANVLCSVCERILPGWFPEPMDVVYNRPVEPYHIIESSVTNIALIDRRLLEQLRPWLDRVAIGRALNGQGEEIPTHATIYPELSSVVERRHFPPQSVRVCVECGTIRPAPASTEPGYLLSYEVADRPVVMNRISDIFVSAEAAGSLNLRDLKPLYLQEIEVRDHPFDGLRYPTDPAWVKGWDATIPWDPVRDGPRPPYPPEDK